MKILKSDFVKIPDVKNFALWFSDNATKFSFPLNIKKSRFVSEKIETECIGIEEVLSKYKWKSSWTNKFTGKNHPSNDWMETLKSLTELSMLFKKVVAENNPEKVLVVCEQILNWGGERDPAEGARPQFNSLKSKGLLIEYIQKAKTIFDGDIIDSDQIKKHISFSGSMWTKVYALISDTGAPIYDTRVAAAMSSLVSLFFYLNGHHSQRGNVLEFLVPHRHKNRSEFTLPNSQICKFKSLKNNSVEWTENTLKLSWIMDLVISYNSDLFKNETSLRHKKHAFEASLFMIGYNTKDLYIKL